MYPLLIEVAKDEMALRSAASRALSRRLWRALLAAEESRNCSISDPAGAILAVTRLDRSGDAVSMEIEQPEFIEYTHQLARLTGWR